METPYKDRNGFEVSVGDFLYYDEGEGYAKGIHLVVEKDGEFYGKTLFYDYGNEWTPQLKEDLVHLKYYTNAYMTESNFILTHAEILGDVDEDPCYFEIDYIERTLPLTKSNPL